MSKLTDPKNLPTDLLQCRRCDSILPKEKFPDIGNVSKAICWYCCADENERKLRVQRVAEVKKVFQRLVIAAGAGRKEPSHICEVAAKIEDHLGGIDQFCWEVVEDLRDARERAPGSKTVLDFDGLILKTIKESTDHRDSAPNVQRMSDDDLAGAMMDIVADVLSKQEDEMAGAKQELLEKLSEGTGVKGELVSSGNGLSPEGTDEPAGDGKKPS